jgi:hypothetical protein
MSVQLEDGTTVDIRIIWNSRSEWFYADITYDNVTLYGVKLVPGFPLLYQYHGEIDIPGDFLVLPITADARATGIQYDDLGVTWFLYWLNDSEIEAWRSARGLG